MITYTMRFSYLLASLGLAFIAACSAPHSNNVWELYVTIDGKHCRVTTSAQQIFGSSVLDAPEYHIEPIGPGGDMDGLSVETTENRTGTAYDPIGKRIITTKQVGKRHLVISYEGGSTCGVTLYESDATLSAPVFSPDYDQIAFVDASVGLIVLDLNAEGGTRIDKCPALPVTSHVVRQGIAWLESNNLVLSSEEGGIWMLDMATRQWKRIGQGRFLSRIPGGFACCVGGDVCFYEFEIGHLRTVAYPSARSHSKAAFYGVLVSPCGRYIAYDVATRKGWSLGIQDLHTNAWRILPQATPVSGMTAWIETDGGTEKGTEEGGNTD